MEAIDNQFNYMMLARLKSDCEYFLNWGARKVKNIYYDSVEEHISEMKKLWNLFSAKPEWLSYEDIENYESQMLKTNTND